MTNNADDNKEYLIVVDENDRALGKLEKQEVHRQGVLHRAFSIFIFNSRGELLLQQRADTKYHSAGLWTNTCCSHPGYGEELKDAVQRRLMEEMGLTAPTEFIFSFIYQATFENGLTEHEYDHVFFGVTDELPTPDKKEVKAWKYMHVKNLEKDLLENAHHYTAWLKLCFQQVMQQLDPGNK